MTAGRDAAAIARRGGLLLLDKPAGVTSFSLVNDIRRLLTRQVPALKPPRGRRGGGPRPPRFKVGHAGTLDPMATGLLLVMIGRASRLSPFLMGLGKSYAATVRFGAATDSHDADGEVVATAPPPAGPDAVTAVLDRFTGPILQVPPVISALKRDGVALYKRARAGEDVAEPEPRPVTIDRLEITDVRWDGDAPEIDLEVACSSGTYVRSLARDLAEAAGSLGHLSRLRRLTVGPFSVADAVEPAALEDEGAWRESLRSPTEALAHLPSVALSDAQAGAVRNGHQPAVGWLEAEPETGTLWRLVDGAGDLVAVARVGADDTGAASLDLAAVMAQDAPVGGEDEA